MGRGRSAGRRWEGRAEGEGADFELVVCETGQVRGVSGVLAGTEGGGEGRAEEGREGTEWGSLGEREGGAREGTEEAEGDVVCHWRRGERLRGGRVRGTSVREEEREET